MPPLSLRLPCWRFGHLRECLATSPHPVIDMGRNHYQHASHPVLVDLPAVPTKNLFDEMDEIADELRENPEHVLGDDEIAFRQLQKFRGPDLSKQMEAAGSSEKEQFRERSFQD